MDGRAVSGYLQRNKLSAPRPAPQKEGAGRPQQPRAEQQPAGAILSRQLGHAPKRKAQQKE